MSNSASESIAGRPLPADAENALAKAPTKLPLAPEAVLDLVQALGALTSESPSQREFAEKLRKAYFDDLPKHYEADEQASGYLREVLVAAASALRGFAVERTAFRRARAREEKLDDVRMRLTEPKFFHSPIDSERWSKLYGLAAKLVVPVAGTAALIRVWERLPWWAVLMALAGAAAWVFVGDLLLTLVIIRLQLWAYRDAGDGHQDVRVLWSSSVPGYKELALQLLLSTDRSRERWYPASDGLISPLRWSDVPPADLHSFLATPHERFGAASPAEILSRFTDLHFGVQPGTDALYVARGKPTSAAPTSEQPAETDVPRTDTPSPGALPASAD